MKTKKPWSIRHVAWSRHIRQHFREAQSLRRLPNSPCGNAIVGNGQEIEQQPALSLWLEACTTNSSSAGLFVGHRRLPPRSA
jgi:hypothetical protein